MRETLKTSRCRHAFQIELLNASLLSRNIHGQGYRIPFTVAPTLTSPDKAAKYAAPEEDALHKKWNQLVQNGQAEVILDNSPGFYSKSFIIPKKAPGEWRLISDLRQLNTYVLHYKKKAPGLSCILPMIRRNDLLSVFDVKDGYFNVPIHPEHRCYFRFRVGRVTYQLNRLPMGYVGSAAAFKAWLNPYLQTLKALFPKVNIFSYVDDCLLILPHSAKDKADETLRDIHRTLQILGVPLKKQKSISWNKRVEYLGFAVCSASLTLTIPKKKAKCIKKQIKQTLRRDRQGKMRLRHVATTIGMIIALLPAVPHGRLHAAALYQLQNDLVTSAGWASNPVAKLPVSAEAELLHWLAYLETCKAHPLPQAFKPQEVTLCASDASDNMIACVNLSDSEMPVVSRELSRKEKRTSINVKEMLAALLATEHFTIKPGLLNFRIDNKTVVSGINKWKTNSEAMRPLLRRLYTWSLDNKVRITATYIHTSANVVADRASRGLPITMEDRAEMALLRSSYALTQKRVKWKMHYMARKDLLRTFSLRPRLAWLAPPSNQDDNIPPGFEPLFHTNPQRKSLYAFPNPHQVQEVLEIISRRKLTVLVTLPCWPAAPWFHTVAMLSASNPLIQPPSAVKPWNQRKKSSPRWPWISVLLSGSKRKRTNYRRLLASPSASPRGPKNATIMGGNGSGDWYRRARIYCARLQKTVRRLKY